MTPDGARHSYAIGPEEQRLRLLDRTVDLGQDGIYLIVVAGDAQEVDDEMRAFNRILLIAFGTFVAVLLVITMLRARSGLGAAQAVFRGTRCRHG
jgi:hypothetical protein